MVKVQEYIETYGNIRIEDQDGFLFWSDGKSRLGGRIVKKDGKVRML